MVYEAPIPKISSDLMNYKIPGEAGPKVLIDEEDQAMREDIKDGQTIPNEATGTAQGQNPGSN